MAHGATKSIYQDLIEYQIKVTPWRKQGRALSARQIERAIRPFVERLKVEGARPVLIRDVERYADIMATLHAAGRKVPAFNLWQKLNSWAWALKPRVK